MTQLTDAALRRSTDFLTSDIHGEIVVLNPETGDCYSLTGVGALVWQTLDEKATLDDIVTNVCRTYDVDTDTARTDAERFLEQLIDEGLVVSDPMA